MSKGYCLIGFRGGGGGGGHFDRGGPFRFPPGGWNGPPPYQMVCGFFI